MPRLTDKQKLSLLADYHAGVNKNQLSIKYDLTPAGVHKICKGIEPKNAKKVNMLVEVAQGLQGQTELEVNSLNAQVLTKVNDLEFFRSASILIAKKAVEKVKNDADISMADIERAQSVIGKGKDNIYGKQPDTAVQINNQNKTYGWEE